jgi:hypothetical protein
MDERGNPDLSAKHFCGDQFRVSLFAPRGAIGA